MAEFKHTPTTASERRAIKRREIASKAEKVFGTGKGSAEPTINPLQYQADLLHALNYYNAATDLKTKRKWTMAYVGKTSTDFDTLSDWEFHSIGTIIRLKQRDVYLEDKELNFIGTRILEMRQLNISNRVKALKTKAMNPEVKVVKPLVSIQDRISEAASTHIGEINGLIDEFIMHDTEVDVGAYLKVNEVSAQVIKLIPASFAKSILEMEEALRGDDKQLVEAYSNFKKPKLKRLIAIYKSIADACQQQTVIVKAARKPRAHKEKPAAVLTANVKYMKESIELKLKSVQPVNIVGSGEVWLYNVKYKKLQVYRAVGEGKLSIKGTTILNYDTSTSIAKSVRTPEVVASYVGMAKRTLAGEFKLLKAKESIVNGRINDECIILKVFP